MTFLNPIMLAGLAAVAIPILIHILNRRKAKVVEWGAMMFLEASLASRNRRIKIEDLILLALRCLLLAALALAMARPFWRTGQQLAGPSGEAQDVVLVLDGSLSMTLENAGKSNFVKGVEEARQVLGLVRKRDAVGLVLAGPTPQAVIPTPLSDAAVVREKLDELTPVGGSLAAVDALQEACRVLKNGSNPGKKIILITDSQKIGWDLAAEARWSFLGEAAGALATKPQVIVRRLEPPPRWSNACAASLTLSRAVVGCDREVKIAVTVANTGMGTVNPELVELLVDGKSVDRRGVGLIAEGSSTSVLFEHRFDLPGPHVLKAEVDCRDDLPGDNSTLRVVDVLKALPVLIVEGQDSPRPLEGDADFIELALAPPPEKNEKVEQLVRGKVVSAADLGAIKKFDDYAVVILADVPQLPAATAKALAAFVAGGGGLLVAPGPKARKEFYDAWNAPDERRLLGCRLEQFKDAGEGPDGQEVFLHVAPNTIDHPALKLLADPAVSDLAAAQIRRRWILAPDSEPTVSLGARLDGGEPYLVQRKVDKGFVLTLSAPLDRATSDLPIHECYLPLLHELVYYLAAPSQQPLNLEPGQQLVFTVPGAIKSGDVAEAVTPEGKRLRAGLREEGGKWRATFDQTAAAGLYRLALPQAALGELATRPAIASLPAKPKDKPTTSTASSTGVSVADARVAPVRAAGRPFSTEAPGTGVPFVVLANPNESRLELLEPADYDRARRHLRIDRAETLSEMTAAIRGDVPGHEIWQYVAILAALVLVGEIAATRAITAGRQVHLAEPVQFGPAAVDAESFRAGRGAPRAKATSGTGS